eukprot:3379476-Amphidinium_carterae.1
MECLNVRLHARDAVSPRAPSIHPLVVSCRGTGSLFVTTWACCGTSSQLLTDPGFQDPILQQRC